MNYIDKAKNLLANKIRVNKNLLDLYLLLVLTKGKNTTLKDVHDAWVIDKNRTFPEHWSLKPFEELSVEVQEKDREYQEAIIDTAKELKGE